jgi:hypothetical protein
MIDQGAKDRENKAKAQAQAKVKSILNCGSAALRENSNRCPRTIWPIKITTFLPLSGYIWPN